MSNNKTIIIYFSHSGNTKKVAELIQQETGASITTLEPETAYPSGFQAAVDEMSRQNKGKILPPFKPLAVNLNDYDTVFLGHPVWDSRLPPVIRTFLRDSNFNGKTIIPFNTHKGFGIGKSVAEIKDFADGAKVLEVLSISEGELKSASSKVKTWLEKTTR